MLKEDGKKEEENEDKLGSSLTINPLQQDSKTQITKWSLNNNKKIIFITFQGGSEVSIIPKLL